MYNIEDFKAKKVCIVFPPNSEEEIKKFFLEVLINNKILSKENAESRLDNMLRITKEKHISFAMYNGFGWMDDNGNWYEVRGVRKAPYTDFEEFGVPPTFNTLIGKYLAGQYPVNI